jgi:small subunit ribosomal protein S16
MRLGKKGEPHYRIVVTEARNKRDGKYVESVGWYNPLLKENNFKVDSDLVKKWLAVGVQPTDTVHDIFAKVGLMPKKVRVMKPVTVAK